MAARKFDEMFQVKGGIPIIAGLYIGMEWDDASPIYEEILSYKTERSSGYLANLIYRYGISYEYSLFSNSGKLKRVVTYIPEMTDNELVFEMRDYLAEKYYHERVDEYLQRDADGEILGYMIDIYNEFYHIAMYSDDLKRMAIELRATKDDDSIYEAFNIISKDKSLEEFIKNSITYCDRNATGIDGIDEVIPIIYGLPSFYNFRLGDEGITGDSVGYLDEIEDYSLIGNKARDDYDLHYEISLGCFDCVDSILLSMPNDSEGIYPVIQYLKKYMFIEEAHYDADYENGRNRIKDYVRMSNSFVNVDIKKIYYDNYPVVIKISAEDEDHPEKYRAMYTIFENPSLFSFFEGMEEFYKYEGKDQDGEHSVVRRKHNENMDE